MANNLHQSQRLNELAVPAYFLYGEEYSDAIFNFIHVEPLRTRNEFNLWKINRHYHPDINQISLLLNGECQFEHDGVFRYVNKPSCVFSPAGLIHEFSYKPQSIGYVFSFTSDVLHAITSLDAVFSILMAEYQTGRVVELENKEEIRKITKISEALVLQMSSNNTFTNEVSKHLLSSLLLIFSSLNQANINANPKKCVLTTDKEKELFEKFYQLAKVSFIQSELDDLAKISNARTIEAFSNILGTSVHLINLACKKMINKTAHELVQDITLREATKLLLYSDITIQDISLRMKYSSTSHFCRFFKSSRSLTPQQFRDKHRT